MISKETKEFIRKSQAGRLVKTVVLKEGKDDTPSEAKTYREHYEKTKQVYEAERDKWVERFDAEHPELIKELEASRNDFAIVNAWSQWLKPMNIPLDFEIIAVLWRLFMASAFTAQDEEEEENLLRVVDVLVKNGLVSSTDGIFEFTDRFQRHFVNYHNQRRTVAEEMNIDQLAFTSGSTYPMQIKERNGLKCVVRAK